MRKESKYRTVIIVEDDDVDAYINQRLLESARLGEEVRIFLDSVEALDFLKTSLTTIGKPAVILLDLNMPVLNGLDFLKSLRELDPEEHHLSVLVITGTQDPHERQEATDHSFVVGLIDKPVTISHLSRYFIA